MCVAVTSWNKTYLIKYFFPLILNENVMSSVTSNKSPLIICKLFANKQIIDSN